MAHKDMLSEKMLIGQYLKALKFTHFANHCLVHLISGLAFLVSLAFRNTSHCTHAGVYFFIRVRSCAGGTVWMVVCVYVTDR